MKYCINCGNAIPDGAAFCPSCGAATGTETKAKKYCTHCGKELPEGTAFCPDCGTAVGTAQPKPERPAPVVEEKKEEPGRRNGLQTTALVFMFVEFGFLGLMGLIYLFLLGALALLYLIPLAWMIPMTVHYAKITRTGKSPTTGFKVCTLLFVNLIAGILMLCDSAPKD